MWNCLEKLKESEAGRVINEKLLYNFFKKHKFVTVFIINQKIAYLQAYKL